jgi:Tfp pilus assembly protein PilF
VDSLNGELAALYVRNGNADLAIQVYENALRRNPAADVAANNLAMLLVTYRKDQRSLDRAKDLTARFASSVNASFLDTYGWVLYKRGEAAAAVATLQDVLAKEPNQPVALYHLGMAQALAGQSAAARDSLTHALESGRNFAGIEEAKATLDKLAKDAPTLVGSPKS